MLITKVDTLKQKIKSKLQDINKMTINEKIASAEEAKKSSDKKKK